MENEPLVDMSPDAIEERKNKRRQKRINAALKTKDINKLMAYDDDE